MTERVGQIWGNYRLVRLLGQGGFADVYLGEHIHLKSLAAIKVLYTRLTDELRENFLNEARILAYLTHPHIIRILDFGIEANGTPFLVMEYAPHGAVRQRYPAHTKLPLGTVVAYIKQVADGLQYAHDQKLIHRDLKPDNLLIGQKEELLLSDFGVAIVSQTTTHSRASEKGFVGTMAYMAPEQLQGKPQFASDQYGLGIIAYEWLCGTRPFQGTMVEVFNQHLAVPPTPLRQHVPALSPDVEQVVLTALAKDPSRRFANVKAFALALEQASQHDVRTSISEHAATLLAPTMPVVPPDAMGAYGPGVTPLPVVGQMTPHMGAPVPPTIEAYPQIATPASPAMEAHLQLATPVPPTVQASPQLATPVPGVQQGEPTPSSIIAARHTVTTVPAFAAAVPPVAPAGPASGAGWSPVPQARPTSGAGWSPVPQAGPVPVIGPFAQPGSVAGDAPYLPSDDIDRPRRSRIWVYERKKLLLVVLIVLVVVVLLEASAVGISFLGKAGNGPEGVGARGLNTPGSTATLTALAGNPSGNGGVTSTPGSGAGVTATVPPTSAPGTLPSATATLKPTPTTPKPTPTTPGCTVYTDWSLHPLGGTTGSDVFTPTAPCNGKVYVMPYSPPPYATQMRIKAYISPNNYYYGPWVSFTTGSWSLLNPGFSLSNKNPFYLQASNVNSGDPYYTIYGDVKY